MLKRIITGAAGIAVFIGVLLLPPVVFAIALALVIIMMLYECYSATKADYKMRITGFISAVVIMAAVYVIYAAPSYAFTTLAVAVVTAVIIHMILVVKEHGRRDYKDVLSNGFLTLYIVLSMSCIWLIKEGMGVWNMLLVFISAWACDTFAYFSGYFFGKHKLIPHVSPKKTVEGSIGGIIGAMVCCVAYMLIIRLFGIQPWHNVYISGALIGLTGGVFSQIGDLTASAIKRDAGIKDFGWIFPGHGGFMDRFDSIVFVAPFIYGVLILSALLGV